VSQPGGGKAARFERLGLLHQSIKARTPARALAGLRQRQMFLANEHANPHSF